MDERFRDLEPNFWPLYETCKSETMTSVERMYALWQAVRHVAACHVPGDIVECGVWRGGSMMMAAHTLLQSGDPGRRLWLYDTYSGMPAPGRHDIENASGRSVSDIRSLAARPDAFSISCRPGAGIPE